MRIIIPMHKRKRLGQHFLNSLGILQKEAGVADVQGKTVLEIGAGDGCLTRALLDAGAARIIAVEKDPAYAGLLRKKFAGNAIVEIREGDFLEMPFLSVDRVVGNIPYSISSAILFRLPLLKWERAVLVVQKEFAEKMMAKPNDSNYGRLSVTAQLAFDIEYVQTVPRRFFSPPPRVDSAMISLRSRPPASRLQPQAQEIIRFLFQHKNQSVRKALKHSRKFTPLRLETLGVLAERRVRTLSKEECLEIAERLKKPTAK